MKLNINDIQEIKKAQKVAEQINIINNSEDVDKSDLIIDLFKLDLDTKTDAGLHPIVGATYADFGDWQVFENGYFEKSYGSHQHVSDKISIMQSDREDKTEVDSYEFDSAHMYVIEMAAEFIHYLDDPAYIIMITYHSSLYYNNNIVVRKNAATGEVEANIFFFEKEAPKQ